MQPMLVWCHAGATLEAANSSETEFSNVVKNCRSEQRVGSSTPGCFHAVQLSAENRLRAVEEGKDSMDPKLAIQPIDASNIANGKAQFGSVEHIQQIESRRAVKVVLQPG